MGVIGVVMVVAYSVFVKDVAELVIADVLGIIIRPRLTAIILSSSAGQPVLLVVSEVLLLTNSVITKRIHVAHVVVGIITAQILVGGAIWADGHLVQALDWPAIRPVLLSSIAILSGQGLVKGRVSGTLNVTVGLESGAKAVLMARHIVAVCDRFIGRVRDSFNPVCRIVGGVEGASTEAIDGVISLGGVTTCIELPTGIATNVAHRSALAFAVCPSVVVIVSRAAIRVAFVSQTVQRVVIEVDDLRNNVSIALLDQVAPRVVTVLPVAHIRVAHRRLAALAVIHHVGLREYVRIIIYLRLCFFLKLALTL